MLIKTKRNKRSGCCILQILKEVPSKLEIQCKKDIYMYFPFDFSWYSIHFDIVCQKQGSVCVWGGGEGGLLNRQNPLSMTKVICRQSII